MNLNEKKCVPCRGDILPFTREQIDEYLKYLFEKISLFNTDTKNLLENSKKEIIEKYGKHIPSLLIEVRDEKIDEILANESN